MSETRSGGSGQGRSVVVAVVVAIVAMGGAAFALRGRSTWVLGLLAHGGANVRAAHSAHRRVTIGVGAVNNNSGAGGADLSNTATEAMRSTLALRPEVSIDGAAASAERGAHQSAQGHYFDANIQSIQPGVTGTRATVSLVVSTYPGRVYEFESSSSATLSGASGAAQAQQDAVRSAMRSAVNRAVDQLLPGS